MITIQDLTYRIEGRLLFDGAGVTVPEGHKVGLVGRNGSGKTTLLRLLLGELTPESGSIDVPRRARIGSVEQEAPGDDLSILETVLAADIERAELLARAETEQSAEDIAATQLRLVDIDAHTAPSRAASILHGLGFPADTHDTPCREFSGGWRMRVALAATLLSEPDVLLLDEPTNYLDLEGTIWLETYIRRYPHTVLMVSHDRDLLNAAVGSILHLDQARLKFYTGGYDRFERTRREQQALELKLKQKQDDARRHMQAFVDRFRYKASKARQAQSRLKALERMRPIASVVAETVHPFSFPAPAKELAPPLVTLEETSVGYAPGVPVLSDLNLRLDPDDRIGLLGANGNGKSTFAKLIAGRLEPQGGTLRHSHKLRVGYFAQHQLDELDAKQTPYDYVRDLMPEATEAQRRARIGQFGFGIEKANTKIGNLSGGEKARMLFTLAAFHGPHILILDEPTNHLDVDSREALVHALNDYEGAVILISHDRHLIETSADRLWLCDQGTVLPFDGDLEDYRKLVLKNRKPNARQKDGVQQAAPAAPQLSPKEQRRHAAQQRDRIKGLRARVREFEAKMTGLQKELAAADAALADPKLYDGDPAKARELAKERWASKKALDQAEQDWLEATETYEQAETAAAE
ncbi:MAG: ABC-F family ATP-binding cassette domain-containing protein [Hyphomicrobiales bacterium]